MKNLKIAFSLVLLSGLFSFGLTAQGNGNSGNHEISVGFDEIALLDVVSLDAVDITLTGDFSGIEAGEPVSENSVLASNNANRLHYTVFNPTGGPNKINVAATGFSGSGWTINVTPEAGSFANSNAAGDPNSSAISLRDGGDLVTGVGKIAWTGTDEATEGYGLLYELTITDIDNFDIDNGTTVQVTYTISEQ
jgi:hypothetical protein